MNLKQFGIIERPSYSFENYGNPGYTVITSGIDGDKKDAYIALKNPGDYKSAIAEILRTKRL